MKHAWEKGEMRTIFLSGNLKETEHTKDIGVDGRIILQ
jgi:hypothetical protein